MGGSPRLLLSRFLENKKIRRRSQALHCAAARHIKMSKRSRRVAMKRRSRRVDGLEVSRRPRNEVGRRVEVLKKLIPSSSSHSMGLNGLFRETADYILALEMRVKIMQIMVKALSTASDDCEDNKY